MAKRYGPIVDAYKKKSRARKRSGGDLFYNVGSLLNAIPSGRRKKRKKRSYSSKKSYSSSTTRKNTTRKATTQTQETEPLTGSDVLTLFVFFAIIVGFCILWSKFGFLLAVLISLILMTIALISSFGGSEIIITLQGNDTRTFGSAKLTMEDTEVTLPTIKEYLRAGGTIYIFIGE